MTVSEELVWLIERLRTSQSRRGRLRLLLDAWRTLRGLSPTDRLVVARELGFEGAERLVDEVAQRRGLEAAPWVELLEGVDRSAGDDLAETVRGLADPVHRGETVDRLLRDAERWATEVGGEHPRPPGAGDAGPTGPSDKQSDELEISDDEAVPPVPPAVAPEVAAQRLPAPVARAGTGDQAAGPSPLAPAADQAVVDAALRLAAVLSVEPRVLARLRRLSASAGALASALRASLAAVLECFPAGWARRRALQRLLEAGVPRSTSDAIALLALLTRPSERMWALTTLAATRRLDDRELEALLATVPSPALRRRLRRRLADGRS